MTTDELVKAAIKDTVAEKILCRTPRRELIEDIDTRRFILFKTRDSLEQATLEYVDCNGKSLTLIFSKGSEIYRLEWQDSFGLTISKMLTPAIFDDDIID